jgi:hypothetical protein
MHDQWEYKLLMGRGLHQYRLKDENGADYGELSQDMLNQLGKEGWEVCSHNLSSVPPASLILKRRMGGALIEGQEGSVAVPAGPLVVGPAPPEKARTSRCPIPRRG